MNLFSDEMRRSPYAAYDGLRRNSPVLRVPPPFNAWLVFDYASVQRVLKDHESFSSRVPAPHRSTPCSARSSRRPLLPG
jgi:cytochrome P450